MHPGLLGFKSCLRKSKKISLRGTNNEHSKRQWIDNVSCESYPTVPLRFTGSELPHVQQGMCDRVAWRTAGEASMAKWWCTQKQCDIVDECLQLHGGYGYMWEYPIARMYADSRVQKIYGGTNEIMKELISRSL